MVSQAAEDEPIVAGVRSLIVPDRSWFRVRRTRTGQASYPGRVTQEGLVLPRGAAGAVTMSLDGVAQVTVTGYGDAPCTSRTSLRDLPRRLALLNANGVWLQMDKVGNLSPVMGTSDRRTAD